METLQEKADRWLERQGVAAVYYCFDAEDRLLYVGCTGLAVKERMRLHGVKHKREKCSPWVERVARVEEHRYRTRAEALAVERATIRRLAPEGNTRSKYIPRVKAE